MHVIVEQLLILFDNDAALDQQQTTSLVGLLWAKGINTQCQFRDGNQHWDIVESFSRATRRTRHGDNVRLVWMIDQINALGPPSEDLKLQHSNRWQWRYNQK